MIQVKFDKRLELVWGLKACVKNECGINSHEDLIIGASEYAQAFLNLYKQYASDELKEYIKNNGLDTYNRTIDIAMSLNDNYEVVENDAILEIKKSNPNFNEKTLSNLLKDFITKTKYDEFYKSYSDFFEERKRKFCDAIKINESLDENIIINFFGYKLKDFEINLYHHSSSNFGMNIGNKIICFKSVHNTPDLYTYEIDTIFHEYSHPYVNPLGNKYFNNNIPMLISEAKEHGLPRCYYVQSTAINEYMVRAISIILAKDYLDSDKVVGFINYQKQIGFIYIEKLIGEFEYKNEYNTFEEFYVDRIIPFFNELEKSLEETKRINSGK